MVLCEFWGELHRLYEESSSEEHKVYEEEQMLYYPRHEYNMIYTRLQDGTRNIAVLGFGACDIRGLTVILINK